MMSQTLLFVLLIGPVVLLMLLRVNAALVFLSLCLGSVLARFVGPDSLAFMGSFAPGLAANYSSVQLALLLVPPALTTMFMIRSVKGNRTLFNLLPAAGTGLLLALLTVPLMSPGLANPIISSSLWSQLTRAQSLIVGLSGLVCLLFLWLQRPRAHKEDHRGKHR